MNTNIRLLLTVVLFLILGGLFFVAESGKSGRDQIIFCDVGQGDGFVVISGSTQVVFDSGLGVKMAECLGRYMPVWDKKIEAMLLTHPQRDHMEGQVEIFKRYDVGRVVWTGARGEGALFDEWKSLLSTEGAEIYEMARGDKFEAGDLSFEVLWPTKSFMDLWKIAPGSDLNETSYVLRMGKGNFCAYFTGDITLERLLPVVDRRCQILKVSHHGSKTGTNLEVVEKVDPKLAIIQVGKSNNYGHPNREVLDSFNEQSVKVLRNDIQDDIKLYFDNDGVYLEK